MSASPVVSIVVPSYNHARFLPQAVDSILGQSYPQVELIVLDDGSTDDTRAVLERYGSRFRWESQANIGQAATINKGSRMARGELLGYVSADDYLRPDAVRRAVEVLARAPEVVLAYPDFEQVDEDSRRLRIITTPEYGYLSMLVRGICPPGPGTLFRRSAFEACGGWDVSFRRIPDFECWLRMGLLGPFRRIPEVLACYRVHRGAQSFSPVSAERADEFLRAIDALFQRTDLPAAVRSAKSQAGANALLYSARLHLMSGRTGKALERAGAALRAHRAAALWPRTYRLLLSGLIWRVRNAIP
jgi:glycosyltransferase involved in cell wall biosynthesis